MALATRGRSLQIARLRRPGDISVILPQRQPFHRTRHATAAHLHSCDRRGGWLHLPDFQKGLGEFAEDVFSIAPTNYERAPELSDPFRKRFGFFMVHEAIESAVTLDVLVQAIERKVGKAESSDRSSEWCAIESGWTKSDAWWRSSIQSGRSQHAFGNYHGPVAQTGVDDGWPKDIAKASPVWRPQ